MSATNFARVPTGSAALVHTIPGYARALRAAASPRAPRRIEETSVVTPGRLYLVDYDWRSPTLCALVLTTDETTFADLLATAYGWIVDSLSIVDPVKWSWLQIPHGAGRLRDNGKSHFALCLMASQHDDWEPCPQCVAVAHLSLCEACRANRAAGCPWDHGNGTKAFPALEDVLDSWTREPMSGRPAAHAVSARELVHTVPYGRQFTWTPNTHYTPGVIRPVARLAEPEMTAVRKTAASLTGVPCWVC